MATTTPADFPTSSSMGEEPSRLASGSTSPPLSSSTVSAPVSTMGTEADFGTGSGLRSGAAGSAPELMNRVVQGAHATIDRLAETAAPHVERWSGSVGHAGESLHQQADRVREMGDEWAESLRTTVRENPLASVGIALAIGLLVARLSR